MESPCYLDNAATSFPKPESVYSACDQWLRNAGSAFGRGSHSGTMDADRLVQRCRTAVAQLLNVNSPDRIAFTFNGTDGLNLLLRGFLRRGHRVITTVLEHNSVLRPLRQLEHELELDVVFADFDPTTGQTDPASVERLLAERSTNLLVINHASNVTGMIQPAAELTQLAHQFGAMVLLDAAQTAGHVPLDLTTLNVDFMAASGHKGLLGPLGTGIVYVAADCEQLLRAARSGGTGTDSESEQQPTAMPAFLESGNMNLPGLAGLLAAVEWLVEEEIDNIHQRLSEQTAQLADELREMAGVTVYGHQDRNSNSGIVSFTIDGADSREVGTILDQSFNIRARTGLHCAPRMHAALQTLTSGGTVRFSPGPFTTIEDINRAIDAVQQIATAYISQGLRP